MDEGLGVRVASLWEVECWRKKELAWKETVKNLVVLDGLNVLLSATIKAAGAPNPWWIGLIDANSFSSFNFNDNSASHPGWFESIAYSEATRGQYVTGPVSNGYVDNAANRASFTITIAHNLRGGFLISTSGKDQKSGTLYGEAQFAAPRAANVSDIVIVKLGCQVTSS